MVTDEDALICDLAETYGVMDMWSLPVLTVATLSIGLGGDSRIMQKMAGQPVNNNIILLAGILDKLSFLAWTKTKDAQTGRNRPISVLNKLLNGIRSRSENLKYSTPVRNSWSASINCVEGKQCQNLEKHMCR